MSVKNHMSETPPDPIELPPDSPMESSFTQVAALPDVVPLERLRSDIEKLSNSDKLDKDAALQMTRLFHAMEMYMKTELNACALRIASLQHELQEQRLRVELDRLATRHIQEEAIMASTPMVGSSRHIKRMSR